MRTLVLTAVPALVALLFASACAESTSDGFGGGAEGGAGQGGAGTSQSTTTGTTTATTTSSSATSSVSSTSSSSTSSTSVASVSSSSSTSTGGACDELLCIAECLVMEMGGQCVNGVCECSGEPIGSIASVGSLIGSTGVFMEQLPGVDQVEEPAFEHDGFDPAP